MMKKWKSEKIRKIYFIKRKFPITSSIIGGFQLNI